MNKRMGLDDWPHFLFSLLRPFLKNKDLDLRNYAHCYQNISQVNLYICLA